MNIPLSKDENLDFYEPEHFDSSWEKLKNILTNPETGNLYEWFHGEPNKSASTKVQDGKLVFGGYVGPTKSIEGYTHELGHLMITPDENIGKVSWGLTTTSYVMSSSGIHKMSLSKDAEIKEEAKAWAWCYLIECMAGLRNFGDSEKPHREADLLEGSRENKKVEYVHNEINKQLKKIFETYKNPYEQIKLQFSRISNVLENNKILNNIINNIDYYNMENIEKSIRHTGGNDYICKLEKAQECDYYVVSLSKEYDNEIDFYECAYAGFDKEKAEKVFRFNTKINELEIQCQNSFKP